MATLVTGASGGVGSAIARELAERGESVGVHCHTDEQSAEEVAADVREAGAEATVVRADVRDPDAVDDCVATVDAELGGLSGVVNTAGVVAPARTPSIDDDRWERVVDTNLGGAFRVARAAMPRLAPGGDLVNVSSVGGTEGTVDAAYAASKAGLHGLTRALAREYGAEGVQVNAVAPGPVETAMNDEIVAYLEDVEFRGHGDVDTHLPAYACPPEEVARTVAHVLLDSEYMQGELVNLNGGMGFR